jgi:hypothetical protein
MLATHVLSEQELRNHDTFGFHVQRALFSKAEVDAIRDGFMEQAKDGPVEGLSEIRRDKVDGTNGGYDASDPLARYPRMMHPHQHPDRQVGRLAMRYMLDRRLFGILYDLIGEEPVAVQSMFYFKPPGARGQDLHQDNFYLRVKPGTCMAAWIAIDDADQDNGGMVVVPNTHNMEIVCPEKADPSKFFTTEHVEPPAGLKPVACDLKAGDVLFFNGSIIHGSFPNTSKTRFRRALICHYVPAGSVELSHWYRTPMRFDATPVSIPQATGGGPCGTLAEQVKGPH